MGDVWFGSEIKSLKPKGPSPPVVSIKPKVCLGPVYLVLFFSALESRFLKLVSVVETLTLKVDALRMS